VQIVFAPKLKMGKGEGKEVQRWDPPNSEIPKFPFPAWGATSKFIRANDLAGPVFPVERKNDAATMTPKSAVPEHAKDMSFPVFQIEKSKHEFTGDIPPDVKDPGAKLAPLVVGPKLIAGDGKSGYVPTTPMHERVPLIAGPVFEGVSSACTFTPQLPPKIESDGVMSYPMLPVEHGSKYTTQDFGCSGRGLNVEKQKVLHGPGNRDTGDRNAAVIDNKNKYLPEVNKKEAPPVLSFPKIPNVESSHQFGPVPARVAPAAARMEMPGPVWPGVESHNEYVDVPERVHGETLFAGPKFPGIESKNSYQEVPEKTTGQMVMAGPCFTNVEHGNHYIPETKRVENELYISGPKRVGIDDSSKYCPKIEKAPIDGERLMTAPIFPGIEASNKYGPIEPPLAPTEKIKSAVPMSTPKYPNIEAKNKYNLEELDNGFPEKAHAGGEHLMTAPKYPGIEESHKYGPVTERKETPKEICVPVYTQDPSNKYSHIPEKQYGELIQQAPVYRGVESKSSYAPVEEKVTGQHVMAGPVYEGVEHDCKYIPETQRVEGQLAMCGPKFRGVADTSLYNEMPGRAPIDGERLMTAPVFPGIEASNNYGPAIWSSEPLKKPE